MGQQTTAPLLKGWEAQGAVRAGTTTLPHSTEHLEVSDRLNSWDFPGSPLVKSSPFNAGDTGLIPDQRAKIPHESWPKNQNIKQKQYCNKFNKDFFKWSTSKIRKIPDGLLVSKGKLFHLKCSH